jgi:hypothetical protein
MNSSLINNLFVQLQGAPVSQIAQQLGTDPATAQNEIAAALPLIMGTLSHHAQQPGGAGALLQALQQGQPGQGAQDDSNADGQAQSGSASGSLSGGLIGSVPGNLAGGQQGQGGGALGGLGGLLGAVLGGSAQSTSQQNAGGMLSQIFGGAQSHAQNGLGQATGLGPGKAGQLLTMLAPMVMAHLGQHVQAHNLDAGGLSAALSQEQNAVQNQGGLAGDLLGAVLSRI